MLLSVMAFAGSLAVLAAFAYPISHAIAGSLAMIAESLSYPIRWKDAIMCMYWQWQSKANGALLANMN